MFAAYGFPQIRKYGLISLAFFLVFLLLGFYAHPVFSWLCAIPLLEFLFVLYFFRDPYREIPQEDGVLVSPADGVVTNVEECEDPGCLGEKALRISIFLSVLDVHLNRAAYAGKVFYKKYKAGEFLNAMSQDSLHRNECNDLGIETEDPRLPKYCLRQIAGLIARRIDCGAEIGDPLQRGEKYGMMKFSSRTDLYLPASCKAEILVKVGTVVRAGTTILAKLS